MATSAISNTEDLIDSRDIIARIEELREELEGLQVQGAAAIADWNDENGHELQTLEALAAQGEDYAPDWEHGETLIRDSYFQQYAMELADDIGAINSEATWPNNCIDWERAARELRMDYSAIEFDRITYWVR